MSTQTVLPETSKVPLKAPFPTDSIIYILYYRQGNNPHPQFCFFHHTSTDMKVISERAKRHCEVMNYRFVYVRAALVDLDRAENLLLNRD
jgi:hypothetical protein